MAEVFVPPRPQSPMTKLQASTDDSILKRRSNRLLEQKKNRRALIQEMNQLLIPKDPDDSLLNPNPEQIELIKDLVRLRKSKWNLKQESQQLYHQQLDTFQHLCTRKGQIEKEWEEMQTLTEKVVNVRQEVQRTLNPHEMTPEERQRDREITQLELDYSGLYHQYQEDVENHNKLKAKYTAKFDVMESKKNEYVAITNEIQNKRRRLDTEMNPFTPQEVENYILSVIVEQKEKYSTQIQALQSKYEPFHCRICSDTVATCVLPCCNHGTCTTCITALCDSTTGKIKCPYCRKDCEKSAIIEMKF